MKLCPHELLVHTFILYSILLVYLYEPQPSRHSFKVQIRDCRLKAFRPAICLLVRNPAFKGFRLGLAAAENKRIQAGFADEARYLLSPVGVTNNDPDFSSSSSFAIA